MLPVSVNQIYMINHRQRRVYLNPKAALFKSQAKMCMPPKPRWMKADTKLELLLVMFTNLYYKNGHVKKFDLQNLEKILIDAVAEKYGHDDCYVWKKIAKKSQEGKWNGVGVCVRPLNRREPMSMCRWCGKGRTHADDCPRPEVRDESE